MKLVGICRVFKLEEVSDKCVKGQIYFSRKNGEEFETDFVNARMVGKAKQQLDELASAMDVEKLKIEITDSVFKNVSYKDKKGNYKNWVEVTIFDFDIPKEVKEEPKQTKRSYRK